MFHVWMMVQNHDTHHCHEVIAKGTMNHHGNSKVVNQYILGQRWMNHVNAEHHNDISSHIQSTPNPQIKIVLLCGYHSPTMGGSATLMNDH